MSTRDAQANLRKLPLHAMMFSVMGVMTQMLLKSVLPRDEFTAMGGPEAAQMYDMMLSVLNTMVVLGLLGAVFLTAFVMVAPTTTQSSSRRSSRRSSRTSSDDDEVPEFTIPEPVKQFFRRLRAPSLSFGTYRYVVDSEIVSEKFVCDTCEVDAGTGERRDYVDRKIRFGMAFSATDEASEYLCTNCAAQNDGVTEGWLTDQ